MADKSCPDCAETIKGEAKVCRFCGYRFDGADASTPSPAPAPAAHAPTQTPATEASTVGGISVLKLALGVAVGLGIAVAVAAFGFGAFSATTDSPKEKSEKTALQDRLATSEAALATDLMLECVTERFSAWECREHLEKVGKLDVGTGTGQVELRGYDEAAALRGDPTARFEVTAYSKSGTEFTRSFGKDGGEASCSNPGQGECPDSGEWVAKSSQ